MDFILAQVSSSFGAENSSSVKSKEEWTQAINRYKTRDGEQGREQGSTQGTETQRNWISPELLEVIESVPYHEHFIHMHEGALPRG